MGPTRRLTLACIVLTSATLPAAAQTQLWSDTLVTTGIDTALTTTRDAAGGIYVGVCTYGSLAAPVNGSADVAIARYDGAGNQLWIRQFGSFGGEIPYASVPDATGGVYVGGATTADLGGPSAGIGDAWLARYDAAGNQLWIRQFGSDTDDVLNAAAPDGAGGVLVAGSTLGSLGGPIAGKTDAWVARYDSAGNQTWIHQIGTSLAHDHARTAAPDGSGGFFVGGTTGGDLGGPNAGLWDAWLARYDGAGNQLWIRQFGTLSDDFAWAAAEDGSGGVFLGGHRWAPDDAWLRRFDGAGNVLWVRNFGSPYTDQLRLAAAVGSGGVIVGGSTTGNFGGAHVGFEDMWLARYDAAGSREWILQKGSVGYDYLYGAASDGANGAFVVGQWGNLNGPPYDFADAYVARFDSSCFNVPTVYCTAKTNSLGCTPSIAMVSSASASTGSGGTVVATGVVGGVFGIFFHSTNGANATPFHGGFLCVNPPLLRHGLLNSGGTAGTCTGSFSEQFNAYIATGADPALVAGAQVWIQNWSRDPAAPFGDGLTDAVTATICP